MRVWISQGAQRSLFTLLGTKGLVMLIGCYRYGNEKKKHFLTSSFRGFRGGRPPSPPRNRPLFTLRRTKLKFTWINVIIVYWIQIYNLWNQDFWCFHIRRVLLEGSIGFQLHFREQGWNSYWWMTLHNLSKIHHLWKYIPWHTWLRKASNINERISNTEEQVLESFDLQTVTVHFILSEIKKLNIAKSTGSDSIPARFLKDGALVLAIPLTHIINLSIMTNTFPE